MMYKILVIDDEKTIREGLKNVIDWPCLGFNCIACAETAADALKIIESEYVDAIITDIVMDDMSGIELIKVLKAEYPHIKCVVISGYDQFEYAIDALRLGAYDYLTKPVKLNELKKTILGIKTLLDEENERSSKQLENLSFMKEQYINNLVKGFFDDSEQAKADMERVGLRFTDECLCIVRIHVGKIDKNSFKELLIKLINKEDRAFVFNNSLEETAVFLNMGSDEFSETITLIAENLNSGCFMGIGRPVSDITGLHISYAEAGIAMQYQIIKPNAKALYYSEIADFIKRTSFVSDSVEKNILHYLDECNAKGLIDYLEQELMVYNCNTNVTYDIFIEIILTVNKYVCNNIDEKEHFQNYTFKTIRSLLYEDDISDEKNLVYPYLNECVETIKGSKDMMDGSIIRKAKQYIDEYYSERITLEKLSQFVFVHPIYLSKLFKDKTGENFIDYLTRVRIENSKILLKNFELRIYDIAYMVGYESSKHFSKVFKDFAGITPKEYRDRL